MGRFTSPTAMVSQINRGVLDFIGAARPSIADPFLPNKILAGEVESIRECIGCNICVSSDNVVAPIRCTQNPTMGEEWRRGWHPEKSPESKTPEQVLVVGAGPAGLESALQLSRRGHSVLLAEASLDVGGRILNECKLPGLASYRRVRDYRQHQLAVLQNVDVLLDNKLTAADILETEIQHVFIATGSLWRQDGLGRQHPKGLSIESCAMPVLTPDDLYAGAKLPKRVLVYDDDHYYLGGVLAESLIQTGHNVTLVTPANCASAWTDHTLEQHKIQARLLNLGINIMTAQELYSINENNVVLANVYSQQQTKIDADAVVMVTSRSPVDSVYEELAVLQSNSQSNIKTLQRIGDCLAPSTVAAAVYSGHLAARELGCDEHEYLYRRESVQVSFYD